MMLPADLIRARKRRGQIHLQYASEEHLSLSKTLIAVHKDHLGRKRGELEEALKSCEELGWDYKLVRGLSALLENNCSFQSISFINPMKARREVFTKVGERVISTEEERDEILRAVALKHDLDKEELEKSLYADLDDEHTLIEFDAPDPWDLIKLYNFALLAALLAHSQRININHDGRDDYLARMAGRLGRLIEGSGSDTHLKIELKPTRQLAYRGEKVEKFLSRLVKKDQWNLSSSVTYPKEKDRATLLEASSEKEVEIILPPQEEEFIIEIPDKKPSVRIKTKDISKKKSPKMKNKIFGEIVVIDDLAIKLGITESRAKRKVLQVGGDFMDLGGVLITEEKRRAILNDLNKKNPLVLKEATRILRRHGCKKPIPVLEALGYTIGLTEKRDESPVYQL
jgi:predicted nuclease of restriction endonuclease-like RecB superfamily